MVLIATGTESLRRLFAGLTEQVFQIEFGIADPPLLDYITDLLVRFSRTETLHRVRNAVGRPLEEVVDLVEESECRTNGPRREVHRHIGDITLFWTGVYPEALPKLLAADRKDHLIDFRAQGIRSYYLASEIRGAGGPPASTTLRMLSEEFDTCMQGLYRVRREWDAMGRTAVAE